MCSLQISALSRAHELHTHTHSLSCDRFPSWTRCPLSVPSLGSQTLLTPLASTQIVNRYWISHCDNFEDTQQLLLWRDQGNLNIKPFSFSSAHMLLVPFLFKCFILYRGQKVVRKFLASSKLETADKVKLFLCGGNQMLQK